MVDGRCQDQLIVHQGVSSDAPAGHCDLGASWWGFFDGDDDGDDDDDNDDDVDDGDYDYDYCDVDDDDDDGMLILGADGAYIWYIYTYIRYIM